MKVFLKLIFGIIIVINYSFAETINTPVDKSINQLKNDGFKVTDTDIAQDYTILILEKRSWQGADAEGSNNRWVEEIILCHVKVDLSICFKP
tara:strand:- start:321 stop:596 length:276 start_codon:yes stop_codon:yes gene_type:complete